MKLLFRSLTIFFIVPILFLTATGQSNAAQPPYDYQTWPYALEYEDPTWGTIPFRNGFYDGDLGEGFGTDKLEHKHGITDLNMVMWVMAHDPDPYLGADEEGNNPNSTLHWEAEVEPFECVYVPDVGTEVCTTVAGPFDVLVGAESLIMDEYYGWPASVTGPDRDNLTPEDESVGLITTFCKGYYPLCPPEINQWTNSTSWLPTA